MGKNKQKQDLDRQSILVDYNCSFVPAQQEQRSTISSSSRTTTLEHNLTGIEVRKFYESVVNDKGSNDKKVPKVCNSKRRTTGAQSSEQVKRHLTRNEEKPEETLNLSSSDEDVVEISQQSERDVKNFKLEKLPIRKTKARQVFDYRKWVSKLLKLCFAGDLKLLKNLLSSVKNKDNYSELINCIDPYGWTALMCAAAEGHLDLVKYLISQGCTYKDVYESSGKDLFEICRFKNQNHIIHYLDSVECKPAHTQISQRITEPKNDLRIDCQLCGQQYFERNKKQHLASTVHIFEDKEKIPFHTVHVPSNNVGLKMMLRSGWTIDKGLGPAGNGRINPIKTVLKQDRTGLGLVENSKKRVSHFDAFDEAAVKTSKQNEEVKRVQKQFTKKTYKRKKMNEKNWEKNMRHYMSSDYY